MLRALILATVSLAAAALLALPVLAAPSAQTVRVHGDELPHLALGQAEGRNWRSSSSATPATTATTSGSRAAARLGRPASSARAAPPR